MRLLEKFSLMSVFMLVLTLFGNSQEMRLGTIIGRVVDADLGTPLEYANVVLYEKESMMQITGAMTDSNGVFRLFQVRPGTYTMEISFMGYYPKKISSLEVSRG
jgi:iron complex outermembrane receptor protein